MQNNAPYLSIISPVYNAEKLVPLLVESIVQQVLTLNISYEIILVEDGAKDTSWQSIEEVCKKNEHIIGIKLSRNFGQHYAITAGLAECRGTYIVVMDCDLQDNPAEIPALLQKAQEGYDLVFAQRKDRQDGFLKKNFSRLFYKIFSYLTNTRQDASIANFGIYHQRVIQAILSMRDQTRYFPAMAQWVGFSKTYLPVTHQPRTIGKSSYNFGALLRLATNTILSFSDKPLRLTIKIGFLIALVSFMFGIGYLYKYLNGDITVSGFTSLIISIWFLSGIIISVLGIIGLYIGKVFENVKQRPNYIIEKIVNK